MNRRKLEPIQVVKERRDGALNALVEGMPYARFMGISFDRRGDELTAVMAYNEKLIGNPFLPALHGGAIASFLEVAAIVQLGWQTLCGAMPRFMSRPGRTIARGSLRRPPGIS